MDTLRGTEALAELRDLREQLRAGAVDAAEHDRAVQEVESCYSGMPAPRYAQRVRLVVDLRAGRPAAASTAVATDLDRVLDLARRSSLRNLHVVLDPCAADGARGMRLSLWYDDESAALPALCA